MQGIRTPNHGIQKIRMKWMKSCTAMDLAMFTSGSWLYGYPYPNLGFAEDAPFMLKLREKTGRVGLMEDVEGLCLHIVHSTSSTPDPAISHHLSEEKLNGLAVSDCTAYEDFMDHYWENFSWITGTFSRVCFTFGGHAEATCEHAGRTNWFHEFPISQDLTMHFCINFTIFKMMQTVL